MSHYPDPDIHRHWKEQGYDGLWVWCPVCTAGKLATRANWEPEQQAFLCLEVLQVFEGGHRKQNTWCQCPVVILWDQKAADAAQALGGSAALIAMGEAQWKTRREPPTY